MSPYDSAPWPAAAITKDYWPCSSRRSRPIATLLLLMEQRKEIPAGSATALLVELDSTIAEGRKGEILAAVAFALDALYRVMSSAACPHAGERA
jgi:hypothetical protein